MKLIVVLDDNNGMMFNNRRQSRDRVLIDDIYNSLEGKLYIDNYSAPLFKDKEFIVATNLLDSASSNDCCFIENKSLINYTDKIDTIVIYKWNRIYPADMYFDIKVDEKYKLSSFKEIIGYSHEKITKETWIKNVL